jgi:hypothetical protein
MYEQRSLHCLRATPYLACTIAAISSRAPTAAFLTKPSPYLADSSLSTSSRVEWVDVLAEGAGRDDEGALRWERVMPYLAWRGDSISSREVEGWLRVLCINFV